MHSWVSKVTKIEDNNGNERIKDESIKNYVNYHSKRKTEKNTSHAEHLWLHLIVLIKLSSYLLTIVAIQRCSNNPRLFTC